MTQDLDNDPFVVALRLGFENQEERAIEQLRALLSDATNDEERGWIVIYEARFLGQLLRVAEARVRLADVRRLWTRTPEHDARIAVGEAVLYEVEGDPARTLAELDKILKEYSARWHLSELHEPYEEIQANRGRLLVGQGQWKEALPLLEETLRSEKGKPGEFYYNLGYCYFMAEEWDKSEQFLKEALANKVDPKFACSTHYYLGRVYYCTGALEQAVREFQTAEKVAPATGSSRKVVCGELARTYKELGMLEEAIRYSRMYYSDSKPN